MRKFFIISLISVTSLFGMSEQQVFTEQEFKTYCAFKILVRDLLHNEQAERNPLFGWTTGGLAVETTCKGIGIHTPWGMFGNCAKNSSKKLQSLVLPDEVHVTESTEQGYFGLIHPVVQVKDIQIPAYFESDSLGTWHDMTKGCDAKLQAMQNKYNQDCCLQVEFCLQDDKLTVVMKSKNIKSEREYALQSE